MTKKQLSLLAIAPVLLGAALLLYMFFPLIQYEWKERTSADVAPAATSVASATNQQTSNPNDNTEPRDGADEEISESLSQPQEPAPEQNELRIDKIGVHMRILEGDESVLDQGAWRFTSPVPGEGKNVSLAAHRFRYRPPSSRTFYLLHKLEPGDEIVVWWNGTKHRYSVDSIQEVEPHQVEVTENHGREELTLVTCAPLLSTARRLIVTAYPIAE